MRNPLLAFVLALLACASARAADGVPYLSLTTTTVALPDGQAWEGDQFPHTMSVLEWDHGGYKYWGWYGLNNGRGIGLARSNDLKKWTKYDANPLLTNARWPSVLDKVDPQHPDTLFFAFTRDYDTPTSYIVLGVSTDGVHIDELKTLVKPVPDQRNQNPNLFRDPKSGRYYLTYYRGNDKDSFDIPSRGADNPLDLDKAAEKVLLRSTETIAAPTLYYIERSRSPDSKPAGVYYMATEICPFRYTKEFPAGDWQVKVFASDAPDGAFAPTAGNPVMSNQRACLFQHEFHGRFYGWDCHLATPDKWVLEQVEAPLP